MYRNVPSLAIQSPMALSSGGTAIVSLVPVNVALEMLHNKTTDTNDHLQNTIQWNLPNTDTNGAEEESVLFIVLISGVETVVHT